MRYEHSAVEPAGDVASDRLERRRRLQHLRGDPVNVHRARVTFGLDQSLILLDHSPVNDSDTRKLDDAVKSGESRRLHIHNRQPHVFRLPSPHVSRSRPLSRPCRHDGTMSDLL